MSCNNDIDIVIVMNPSLYYYIIALQRLRRAARRLESLGFVCCMHEDKKGLPLGFVCTIYLSHDIVR